MTTEYFTSTSPGKTWAVSYYKPEGRPGYYVAQEGERGEGFFRCALGLGGSGDRRLTTPVASPATAKRKAQGRLTLLALLRAEGLIAASQEDAA